MPSDPIVFISSTREDLKEYREQAAKAAKASGFATREMEYFPARGAQSALADCRAIVAEADLVVVIVAHRYGWVPDGPENPDAKSITWLECEEAWKVSGKEVLAFLVDPNYDWPTEQYEGHRLNTERRKPGILDEVERNEQKLDDFKQLLGRKFIRHFTAAGEFRALVSESLADWRLRHASTVAPAPGDPETYLKYLEDDTRQIRVTGLRSKRAEPYVFQIDEIYIPLTTLATRDLESKTATPALPADRREVLQRALSRHTVVIGEPGSGKSTFLRRVAFELCRQLRDTRPADAPPFLTTEDRRFPILIRTADLAQLLAAGPSPIPPEAPDWIPHFLGQQSDHYHWNLNADFFRRKLDEGGCLVMVDGLDEAPDPRLRKRISRLFENATKSFAKCDFLVTTRPQSYTGDSVLAADFQPVRIKDLELDDIRTFFDHFAHALALTSTEAAKFKSELEAALDRPEIRDMARNPVMLTALAVLQHNDERLPEYRVQLYGSILDWLAAAGEDRPDRLPAKSCIEHLRKLALHMQDAPGARLVQMNLRAAAEFSAGLLDRTVDASQELLLNETEDGVLSPAGDDVKFWHLSFQEYLAAREIAGLDQDQLVKTVVESGKLYHPEWREVMCLLGGELRLQGTARIEWFVKAILSELPAGAPLAERAKCAALLGAMMQDLKRMGYTPETEDYERTVRAVEQIFETGPSEQIDIKTRIEAADAYGQAGDPRLDRNNWVTIPAGTFLMGAQKKNKNGKNYDPEIDDDESPVHEVELSQFRICRYPVTVQEFAHFIEADGYDTRKYWKEGFGQFTEPEDWEEQQRYPNRPVVSVSWFEAAAYCAWAGGRFPTEAEWERAARGPKGTRYPWGREPVLDHSLANYDEAVGHPTPVGLYPKGDTPETLCDMLGNVWEWCSDWFGDYEAGRQRNPTGPPDGSGRILRGGSWFVLPQGVRVSCRVYVVPTNRSSGIGFRCAGD